MEFYCASTLRSLLAGGNDICNSVDDDALSFVDSIINDNARSALQSASASISGHDLINGSPPSLRPYSKINGTKGKRSKSKKEYILKEAISLSSSSTSPLRVPKQSLRSVKSFDNSQVSPPSQPIRKKDYVSSDLRSELRATSLPSLASASSSSLCRWGTGTDMKSATSFASPKRNASLLRRKNMYSSLDQLYLVLDYDLSEYQSEHADDADSKDNRFNSTFDYFFNDDDVDEDFAPTHVHFTHHKKNILLDALDNELVCVKHPNPRSAVNCGNIRHDRKPRIPTRS
jgi:hypothetical protein